MLGYQRPDNAAVPHNYRAVRVVEDFLHPVRDQDNRDPLRPQTPKKAKQLFSRFPAESGGRLIEYEQPYFLSSPDGGLGDLHHLSMSQGKLPNKGICRNPVTWEHVL